jgi:hypothetical protein
MFSIANEGSSTAVRRQKSEKDYLPYLVPRSYACMACKGTTLHFHNHPAIYAAVSRVISSLTSDISRFLSFPYIIYDLPPRPT